MLKVIQPALFMGALLIVLPFFATCTPDSMMANGHIFSNYNDSYIPVIDTQSISIDGPSMDMTDNNNNELGETDTLYCYCYCDCDCDCDCMYITSKIWKQTLILSIALSIIGVIIGGHMERKRFNRYKMSQV